MNKLLWLILLILWIGLGCWCVWNNTCNIGGAVGAADGCSVWKIMDGNKTVHEADANVKFNLSDASIISESAVNSALSKVADYLENNNRTLTVVGYYSSSENNSNSSFSNLGLSRAESIKAHLINEGAPASKIKTNSVQYNENCYDDKRLNRGARFMFGS